MLSFGLILNPKSIKAYPPVVFGAVTVSETSEVKSLCEIKDLAPPTNCTFFPSCEKALRPSEKRIINNKAFILKKYF